MIVMQIKGQVRIADAFSSFASSYGHEVMLMFKESWHFERGVAFDRQRWQAASGCACRR
jgi:hypothetical protein